MCSLVRILPKVGQVELEEVQRLWEEGRHFASCVVFYHLWWGEWLWIKRVCFLRSRWDVMVWEMTGEMASAMTLAPRAHLPQRPCGPLGRYPHEVTLVSPSHLTQQCGGILSSGSCLSGDGLPRTWAWNERDLWLALAFASNLGQNPSPLRDPVSSSK